jgi:hypothetical protein
MLVITKSETYKVGVCGIRAMLNGDKDRADAFERGESIEVSEDEYQRIFKVKFCNEIKPIVNPEVKDGN